MGDRPRLGIRLHGGLSPQHCAELAMAVEAKGFASVWLAENPLERGALLALAACATATRRTPRPRSRRHCAARADHAW
jgi:alkanesulfonate monooxygenase SsuD/methylene tetrahydromethanopterin reductase-like flavin-dependent oxidoreductase (luciferase family)